jgi:hypothetical protein
MTMDNKKLIRFYQAVQDRPLFVVLYRLKDGFDHKQTFKLVFCIEGLTIKTKYKLYSSWDNTGTPLSISNLTFAVPLLPKEQEIFITEEIEEKLLIFAESIEIMNKPFMGEKTLEIVFKNYNKEIKFMNQLFDNIITKLEKLLKKQENCQLVQCEI